MKFKIVGRPEFFFTLTREQIELLCSLSTSHYDFESRSLSKPGGFIYGWNFRLDDKDQVEVSATWRQLDSVSRILENIGSLDADKKSLATKLAVDIFTVLIAARDEICPAWEATIDDTKVETEKEYIISTFNTGGSGWEPIKQNGVKIIHVPSGLEARCSEERSIHRNKHVAMETLQTKVGQWKLIHSKGE